MRKEEILKKLPRNVRKCILRREAERKKEESAWAMHREIMEAERVKRCAMRREEAAWGFYAVRRVTKTAVKRGDGWLRQAAYYEVKQLRASRALAY